MTKINARAIAWWFIGRRAASLLDDDPEEFELISDEDGVKVSQAIYAILNGDEWIRRELPLTNYLVAKGALPSEKEERDAARAREKLRGRELLEGYRPDQMKIFNVPVVPTQEMVDDAIALVPERRPNETDESLARRSVVVKNIGRKKRRKS